MNYKEFSISPLEYRKSKLLKTIQINKKITIRQSQQDLKKVFQITIQSSNKTF
jgi:hypothetical protein